jgi:hypothetical protein
MIIDRYPGRSILTRNQYAIPKNIARINVQQEDSATDRDDDATSTVSILRLDFTSNYIFITNAVS